MDTMERIDIDPIEINEVTVTIEGLTPLVVHNFGEKARTDIRRRQQKEDTRSAKKEKRDPKAEFEAAKYKMTDGRDGFSAIAIKMAMIDAGYRHLGLNKTDIRQDVFIPGELVAIRAPEAEMIEDVVRLSGPGRPADLRYRPYYFPWEIDIPIEYKPNRMSLTQIVSTLAHAGFSGGLGEWRPEKNGDKGRFRVKEVIGS